MTNLIKTLGSSGSKTKTSSTVSFQVNKIILIDAGNVISRFEDETKDIQHIFITHAHFDHIIELPFLIENDFVERENPLNIYGLPHTIETLKKHIFNNSVWPDFSKIPLLKNGKPSIIFQIFHYGDIISIGDIKLKSIKVNHLIPTSGFVITRGKEAILISGDTYISDEIWEEINRNLQIKTLFIEVSFHSVLEQLAKDSKHLTPKLLDEELNKLTRTDLEIYIYHIKDSSLKIIKDELKTLINLKNFKVKALSDKKITR
jgi:cAMP phosphodiesterase